MSDEELYSVACGHLIFEESSTEINEGAAKRLAGLLSKVQEEEATWWHKEWHQATGIPCDGGSEYCPLKRRAALAAFPATPCGALERIAELCEHVGGWAVKDEIAKIAQDALAAYKARS